MATSAERWRPPAACSSSSPTPVAPATTRHWTRRGARLSCAHPAPGPRSPTLHDLGYQDVAVLEGGLKGWTDAGLPTNEHEYTGL